MENNAVSGLKWQSIERIFNAICLFILGVVVARIVGPSEYGIVSLTTVFVTFSDLLVNGGLGSAIIQKETLEDKDVNDVFTITTILSIMVGVLLVLIAPKVAAFYSEIKVKYLLRLYALGLWPFAIYGLLRSVLTRKLEFKKLCIVAVVSLLVSCILTVILALCGCGVYSMVAQSLSSSIVGLISLIALMKPKLKIRWKVNVELIRYGWKILCSNIIDTSYKSLPTVIVAKAYSISELSLFTYGRQISNVIVSTINSTIVTTLFPLFSREQKNIENVKSLLRKTITNYAIIFFPFMTGLAMCSDEIIRILAGSEWDGAGFFLAGFCFVYLWYPLHSINFQAIAAIGKSDVYLLYEIIKKTIGVLGLFLSISGRIEFVLYMQVIVSLLFWIIGFFPTKKYFSYNIWLQVKDVMPGIFIAICVCVLMGVLQLLLGNESWIKVLIIKVGLGLLLYVFSLYKFLGLDIL